MAVVRVSRLCCLDSVDLGKVHRLLGETRSMTIAFRYLVYPTLDERVPCHLSVRKTL